MLPATVEGYPVKWSICFQETLAASTVADSSRGFFQLPEINIFTSFGAIALAGLAGTVTPKLRIGLDTFTVIGGRGLDFIALAAANRQDIASVGYAIGAAAPNVPGNNLFILPPVVQVFVTTAAFTGTYQILYACVGVP